MEEITIDPWELQPGDMIVKKILTCRYCSGTEWTEGRPYCTNCQGYQSAAGQLSLTVQRGGIAVWDAMERDGYSSDENTLGTYGSLARAQRECLESFRASQEYKARMDAKHGALLAGTPEENKVKTMLGIPLRTVQPEQRFDLTRVEWMRRWKNSDEGLILKVWDNQRQAMFQTSYEVDKVTVES